MDEFQRLAPEARGRVANNKKLQLAVASLAIVVAAGSQAKPGSRFTSPESRSVQVELMATSETGDELIDASDVAEPGVYPSLSTNDTASTGTAKTTSLTKLRKNDDFPRNGRALDLTVQEDCLTLNIYWEARNQPFAGQLAVAQVTMNRARDPRYPDDVCEVVFEHKQFSWFWDGKSDTPDETDALDTARMVASAAISGSGHAELEGVTHYHAIYAEPYWSFHMTQVAIIGDHAFYADESPSLSLTLP